MYVCFCQEVTEQEIRDEMARGARDLADISERLGVATGCGRCAGSACGVIAAARAEQEYPELPVELAPAV